MGETGIFTRQSARDAAKMRRSAVRELPLETARRIGPRAVRTMNPDAETPEMKPIGVENADVFILLEAPRKVDDRHGTPLYGELGSWYRKTLSNKTESWRADHICRTLPPKGRTPNPVEIEAFRTTVLREIEQCAPNVILACGHEVMKWLSPNIKYSAPIHRGRVFPMKVGKYCIWVVATISPAMAEKLFEDGDKAAYGEDHRRAVKRDIELAASVRMEDAPDIEQLTKTEMLKRSTISLKPDYRLLDKFNAEAGGLVSIDIETINLRPYSKGSRILSVALVSGTNSLSMPVDHPEVIVSEQELTSFFESLARILEGRKVVAHNLQFELEWLIYFMGTEIIDLADWRCTQVGAYTLDNRAGQSLDYQTRMYMGFGLKGLSKKALWNEYNSVRELLEYNLLDAKLGLEVYFDQRAELHNFGRWDAFLYHMKRIPALASVQARGMPCKQTRVREFQVSLRDEIRVIDEKARKLDEVKDYEKRFGHFSLSSPDNVSKLFEVILQRDEGERAGGKYSTNEAVLSKLIDVEPAAKLVLAHRAAEKKLGTYVTKFLDDHPDTYVYPDGLLHCNLRSTATDTRRLACMDPNNQNWPYRKGREMRRIIEAERGHKIVSFDYGQIEARGLAMVSKDPAVLRMFTEDGYDVHMVWAEKLVQAYPSILRRRGNMNMKDWRSRVKNEFVFPLFYGAGIRTVSRGTQIPEESLEDLIVEFWDVFAGVKQWQQGMHAFYKKHFYVESLTGYRRHGPMKSQMVTNATIQCLASDFCVHAMVEMCKLSRKLGKLWLTSIINVHDDLTFMVPESEVPEMVKLTVRTMLDLPYDFINVPITCEVTEGNNWCDMEPVGVFTSTEVLAS